MLAVVSPLLVTFTSSRPASNEFKIRNAKMSSIKPSTRASQHVTLTMSHIIFMISLLLLSSSRLSNLAHTHDSAVPHNMKTTGLVVALLASPTVSLAFSSPPFSVTPTSTSLKSADDGEFVEFCEFLRSQQRSIIEQLEAIENGAAFSKDGWGSLVEDADGPVTTAGGLTRVIQGGDIIEKGACSLTILPQGILTDERAATIRARQSAKVRAGDRYAAAALSMVLHTRSPLVPTFRSDVRIFVVFGEDGMAWYGGGADLTPYYLFESDIESFHEHYQTLCGEHFTNDDPLFSYPAQKKACDEYFYLPARAEHRGTGGVFFDDLPVSPTSTAYCKSLTQTWMPSWLPIVQRRSKTPFTSRQKDWQLLRRGRYLEFNLLYDRGVKFGLANANPRVEGVMVSAPPMIAYEYNHKVEPGSPEAELVKVLKQPKEWV